MSDKMTKEQAELLGPEYVKIIEAAEQQLSEHKLWLRKQLHELAWPNPEAVNAVQDREDLYNAIDEVPKLRLEAVRMEQDKTLSAIYDYPDALYSFLMREDCPEAISLRKSNARVIVPVATAERVS